jgi:hypothetical protein
MVRLNGTGSSGVAVVVALSLQVLSASPIEQDGPRRVREAALGGTIHEALQPDDDVVEISWPSEETDAFWDGDSSIAQLQETAKQGPLIAAIVTATSVSGMLVQNSTWIYTRFIARVDDVILTSPDVPAGNRVARGRTIEFRTRAGELMIGRVTVRAGVQMRYPAARQYLVFLHEQHDGVWTIYNRAPLLIDGDRVRFPALEPVQNSLSGMLLSDVTRAVRTDSRVFVPRDQSDEDAEFAVWIRRVRAAAETGDLATLRDACTPVMSVYFEPLSRDKVIDNLVPDRPWRELRDALRLGVARRDDIFVAPYTYGADLLEDDEVAITGRGVHMRRAPEPAAPVVATLWLNIVKQDDSHYFSSRRFDGQDNPAGRDAWAKVTAPNGVTGYVYGRYVRHMMDIRFIFERIDGQWKITGFAAGD